jgi:hypothetical protein
VTLAIGDTAPDFETHSTDRKDSAQRAIKSDVSAALNDFNAVCLWVLIGIVLSILASVSSFGIDLAAVLAAAE